MAKVGEVVHPAPDVVEAALADAITRAAVDGRHDVVRVLVDELTARREARAGVVQLRDKRRGTK
jgi:hypothetical protein